MRIGFLDVNWTDLLDVGLVAFLLYQVYYLVKGSIASRVFLGYMLVYVSYLVVKGLQLELLTAILQYFMGVGAIALIVIFQQEIRRFLMIIGKSTTFTNNRLLNSLLGIGETDLKKDQFKTIASASQAIAADFNGAIIVIKKKDDLEKYIQTGTYLDAALSKPLLICLFNQYSSLREGAVIISEGRISASHCILPVMEVGKTGSALGFRHRAAIGMSESTDAVVIVISEQTGKISLAVEGELLSNIRPTELENLLTEYVTSDSIRTPASN